MSNEENNTIKAEAEAALNAIAGSDGHPVTTALGRIQNELRYYSCRPFNGPEEIEEVCELNGADFKAGDIARTAISSFGVSTRDIFDWCVDRAKVVADRWCLKASKEDPSASEKVEREENESKQKIKAYELLGLAQLFLYSHDEGDGFRVPGEVWNHMEENYDNALVVQVANTVLSFACELIWENEDLLEVVEMHVRGFVRQAAAADRFSADASESVTGWLVDNLAAHCASRANVEALPRREESEEVPHAAQ
jgi:hypothetical protein